MLQIRKLFLIVLISLLLLVVLVFSLLPLFIKPEWVKSDLVTRIEEFTNGQLAFEQFDLKYFPSPHVQLQGVALSFNENAPVSVKADSLSIRLALLPALLGKKEISHFQLENGQASLVQPARKWLHGWELKNMSLSLSPVKNQEQVKLSLQGDFEGMPGAFLMEGTVGVQKLEDWSWSKSSFHGTVALNQFPLKKIQDRFDRESSIVLKGGELNSHITVQKEKDKPWVHMNGNLGFKKAMYEFISQTNIATSPEIDGELTLDMDWNPDEEQVRWNQAVFKSILGIIEMNGQFSWRTQEIQNMRISGIEIAIDAIPQYYLPLKEAIPYNMGFSGKSDLEFSINGTLDHLTIHGNWDLTPSLLTYGAIFIKPKELPMNVIMDFLLADGKILSGDFSLRLQAASLKGTLTDLQVKTGEGQLNLITNKFDIVGWEQIFLPLQDYKSKGNLKLLVNMKGNLFDLPKAQRMMNLILDEAEFHLPSGTHVHDLFLTLDYTPLVLDIKNLKFKIQDSEVKTKVRFSDLSKDGNVAVSLSSPQVDATLLMEAILDLIKTHVSKKQWKSVQNVRDQIESVFPKGEQLSKLQLTVTAKNKIWDITELTFDAYEGATKLVGQIDFNAEVPSYLFDLEVNRWSLARYLSRKEKNSQMMNGNLFIKTKGSGAYPLFDAVSTWSDSLEGQGALMITNGEFNSFNVLGALRSIKEFSNVKQLASETTAFHDLQMDFTLSKGKVLARKMRVLAPDFTLEAFGDISFDGVLNYRLDAFFSPTLTDEILAPLLGQHEIEGEQQFGPIPLLLSGPLNKPELKVDVTRLPELLDQVMRKKTQRILRNFVPEAAVFDRETERV